MEFIWIAVITGFGAGLFHVLSGPDHVAAVAPLALGKGPRGWRTGLQWALGHTAGVLLIGLLALLFRQWLPIQAISSWSEKFVGLLLIAVGAWGICKITSADIKEPPKAAFGIGIIHGLAGSSHLLGVLPALLFPSVAAMCSYFIAFGAGTILGMLGFASFIGLLPARFYRPAMTAFAALAVGLGCYWLVA
jgi:hypothetical protein